MPEPLFHPEMMPYLESLVPQRDPVMEEMETYARQVDFPIIGPAAGYFLYQIARLSGARQVFELGSGFGYSTAWFARAVQENGGGTVHHVVWDEDLSGKARGYLGRLGYDGIVRYHVGEAVATLATMTGPFDLMFNDIDKRGYPASISVIKDKLRPGGVLMIDNMLWSGRLWESSEPSEDTRGVREVTRLLAHDPEFVTTLVPIRDGVVLAWRVG